MNEDVFNMSLRKFLKKVGVTSQREIEKAVRAAVDSGRLSGKEKLEVVVSLKIDPDGVIERHGLGVMARSTARAAETIVTLIQSCEERETMGARARDYAIRTHSAEAVARLIEQALHSPFAPVPHAFENAAES